MSTSVPTRTVIATLVGLWAFIGCTGDTAPMDAGPDAAFVDAGPPDSGPPDSGAVPDVGRMDAGTLDAGDPGWQRVPGLPAACLAEVTIDPGQLEGFDVTSCEDMTGCEEWRPEWPWGPINVRADSSWLGSSDSWLVFTRNGSGGHLEQWVVTRGREVRLGIRGAYVGMGLCYVAHLEVYDDRFAFLVTEPDAGLAHSWLIRGEITAGSVRLENLGRLSDGLPSGSAFFYVRVGRNRIGLESVPWHSIYDVTWDGAATRVGDPTQGGETYLAAVVGDTILYDVYGGYHHVRAARAGSEGEVLIAPAGAEANAVVTDGTDLAWIQSYGRVTPHEFARLELWTSPYADRAEDLVPRWVADLPGTIPSPPITMGPGHVAIWQSGTEVGVYRLADGARASLTPPDGRRFRVVPPLITADEIVVPIRRELGTLPPQDEVIRFIRLGSLDFVSP